MHLGRYQPAHQRRGVLLLAIIGVLVLVSLLAMTWVVSARYQKSVSRSVAKHRRWDQNWQQALDEAMAQVARGTENRLSVLGPHSLLEDLYGTDGTAVVPLPKLAVPTVFHPQKIGGGEVHELLVIRVQSAPWNPLAPLPDYYTGCVWTFVGGPADGESVRVVGYQYDPAQQMAQFLLQAPRQAEELVAIYQSSNPQGVFFVVNGRPFNGVGFPLNPANGVLTFNPRLGGPDAQGGADEDYDIPDLNNWILAGRFWTGTDPRFAPNLQNRWLVLIPSLHRPALVNALAGLPPQQKRRWILRPLGSLHPVFGQNVNPQLTALLESNTPLPAGMIPGVVDRDGDGKYDAVLWDVDNDGDGVPDSIWVDLGFPVARDRKGRLYKPLFAILCLDLDNRLNLSVHGSHTLLQTPNLSMAWTWPSGVTVSQLPRGQGYGPAGVNLRTVFNPTELGRLLFGAAVSGREVPGRYGLPSEAPQPRPGLAGTAPDPLDARFVVRHTEYLGGYRHGDADFDEDSLLWATPIGQPQWVQVSTTQSSVQTNFTATEQSLAGGNPNDEINDNPYKFDPYQVRTAPGTPPQVMDVPFGAEELELVLRLYDRDSVSLDRRLHELVPDLFSRVPWSQYRRGLLTAESYDLPVPAVQLPDHLRRMLLPAQPGDARDYPNRLDQNVRQRIAQWLGLDPADPQQRLRLLQPSFGQLLALQIIYQTDVSTNVNVWASVQELLAPQTPGGGRMEVSRLSLGQRMDVNRLWSNGRDDNNNGTVDEPAEQRAGETLPYTGAPADWNNDGQINAHDALGRQLYARHLYMLAMALKEPGATLYLDLAGMSDLQKRRAVARRLAQWAVNVVDFRDPDSICTPFFVDLEPFVDNNGDGVAWDAPFGPNGEPIHPSFVDLNYDFVDDNRPWLAVVWGAERPELLITETMAWHDFRTEDLDNDDGDGKTVNPNDPTDPDPNMDGNPEWDDDFDQRRRPQGSVFVELYRPWYDMAPAELRAQGGQYRNQNFVDLSRLAPPGAGGRRYPVWQLVVGPTRAGFNRPSQDPLFAAPLVINWTDPGEAERIVWFTTDNLFPGNPRVGPEATRNRIYYCRLDQSDSLATNAELAIGFSTFGPGAAPPDVVRKMFLIGPGEYRLVGPRVLTRIGRSGPGGTRNQLIYIRLLDQQAPEPRPPAAVVNTEARAHFATYPAMGQQIKPVMGIPITYPRPFTISEPLPNNYYPNPNATSEDVDVQGAPWRYSDRYDPPLDAPLDPPNLRETRHHDNYRGLYLLRLANPLEPYHPTRNPYLVVDYSPVDLSVYNGEAADPNKDPDDLNGGTRRQNGTIRFGSQERSGEGVRNVWKQFFPNPDARAPHNFIHSLGFLNGYGAPGGHRRLAAPGPIDSNGGTWTSADPVPPQVIGEPRGGPYPWFPWPDRPFVSPMELLLVPSGPPSRVLQEADYPRQPATQNDFDPVSYPFTGMFSWFAPQSRLHRVLEYLHVPSRFAQAEQMFSPASMSGATNVPHRFHPPFNFLSRFREPGKVNLNTAFDQGHVLAALLSDPTYARAQHWPKVLASLQGAAGTLPVYRQGWPTFFFNPLRSYAAEELRWSTNGLSLNPSPADPTADVHRTFLRRDPQQPNRPLFVAAGPGDSPGAGQSGALFRNANLHPVFRYLPLNKLANVATTRSNVYAVWITMGYFEVIPDASKPDGFQLGRELGSDTGEVVRHRAFYIFDRSVPMGFVRGQDLNVHRGIRLRRYIE